MAFDLSFLRGRVRFERPYPIKTTRFCVRVCSEFANETRADDERTPPKTLKPLTEGQNDLEHSI